jgi:hypothetical protein
MTRLQSYLLTEGRTQGISKEEAKNILHTKCKQAIKTYRVSPINRIIDDFYQLYGMVYPSSTPRQSRNTENYYTLIINNSPEWSNFPKREIICSTYSNRFRSSYCVFPFDGAKIGVCPTPDIWGSFKGIYPQEVNKSLSSILYSMNKTPQTYKELKDTLSEIHIDDSRIKRSALGQVFEKYGKRANNLFELIMCIYGNPKGYGFSVKKIGSKLPEDVEVWTDAPCLLIGVNTDIEELIG